ncbi:MAG: hypothetical protein HY617_00820 [Candidatus Sungbacteria bacterium]|nr:hypothetical protein [Candidatus Sungbacteria bacterium]
MKIGSLFLVLLLLSACSYGGGARLNSAYRGVPYQVEYGHQVIPYYLPDYYGRQDEWVVPGLEYHFERGGGGVYHQGGCYSLRGWEYNRRGYPQLIPPGAKIGNCR